MRNRCAFVSDPYDYKKVGWVERSETYQITSVSSDKKMVVSLRNRNEDYLTESDVFECNEHYQLETVPCPLCGSDEYSDYIVNAKELYIGMPDKFTVVCCDSCGHCYTNPRPTRETISYFYPDKAGYYQPVKPDLTNNIKRRLFNGVLNKYYGYKSKCAYTLPALPLFLLLKRTIGFQHIPNYIDGGKVLDIGCSWGGYLFRLKHWGWDVYGTEINQKAVNYAQDNGLENIHFGMFEDIDFESEFFDAINLSMVLEHTYDPVSVINKAQAILKPGGQLTLSVPDIRGFEARHYLENCYTLQVPQHLQHFSSNQLKKLLKQCGFKVEKVLHHNFDRDLVASANYSGNQRLFRFLSHPLIRKTLVKFFVGCLSFMGQTSRMSVYARKAV